MKEEEVILNNVFENYVEFNDKLKAGDVTVSAGKKIQTGGAFYWMAPALKVKNMKGFGSPVSVDKSNPDAEINRAKGWLVCEDQVVAVFMKKVLRYVMEQARSKLSLDLISSVTNEKVAFTLASKPRDHRLLKCFKYCRMVMSKVERNLQLPPEKFCVISWLYPNAQLPNGKYDMATVAQNPWFVGETGTVRTLSEVKGEINSVFVGQQVKFWMNVFSGKIESKEDVVYDDNLVSEMDNYVQAGENIKAVTKRKLIIPKTESSTTNTEIISNNTSESSSEIEEEEEEEEEQEQEEQEQEQRPPLKRQKPMKKSETTATTTGESALSFVIDKTDELSQDLF